jgi:hypothetical protein
MAIRLSKVTKKSATSQRNKSALTLKRSARVRMSALLGARRPERMALPPNNAGVIATDENQMHTDEMRENLL